MSSWCAIPAMAPNRHWAIWAGKEVGSESTLAALKCEAEESVAPPGGQDRIMIYGPKSDGTYIIEFRMADGESLAISVPAGEIRVLKHFQAPESSRRCTQPRQRERHNRRGGIGSRADVAAAHGVLLRVPQRHQLGTHEGLGLSELATSYRSRSAFASSVRPSASSASAVTRALSLVQA